MNVEQVKDYCANLIHASSVELGSGRNILSYQIDAKKFAYFKTSEPEQWRFSIKVTPERFLELTDQQGIKPARYMHRFHWVSIVNVNTIDTAYLKELIEDSYQKAFLSLSQKRQLQLKKV
jgi:predicted DNA-binding protein (MmcQ/YjbR family)